jgi:hypothetical protein
MMWQGNGFFLFTMKPRQVIFSIVFSSTFFCISAVAQPTVTGMTSPAKDTTISLPTNSVTLTGTAKQANPGHPILDTSWVQTSGPALATITNPDDRMTTTVTGLVQGNYVFTLTATDKQNAASVSVNVHVIPGTLPIQLAYFDITPDNAGLLLTWQTSMESNNAYFVVQKSTDDSTFTDIATIMSKAENGNSNVPLNYSYQILGQVVEANMYSMLLAITLLSAIALVSKLNKFYKSLVLGVVCLFLFSCSKSVSVPKNTIPAKTEYRLKQVALDGTATYSTVKLIN